MSVHEVIALRRENAALERENQHLKEMLSEMADALYADAHRIGLQAGLERLVVLWMERANRASLRAFESYKRLHPRKERFHEWEGMSGLDGREYRPRHVEF